MEEEGEINKFVGLNNKIKNKYTIILYSIFIIIIIYLLINLIMFNQKINQILLINLLNKEKIIEVKEYLLNYMIKENKINPNNINKKKNNLSSKDSKNFSGTSMLNSKDYWEKRYSNGGNSGEGSYNHLAFFKSSIINNFVKLNNISTVIEWGSGDCNQLKYANYKNYIGYDVSQAAVNICKKKFYNDSTKTFYFLDDNFINNKKADLSLSLDVIFHLIEDKTFDLYMKNLFNSSNKYIIIYSSNIDSKYRKSGKYVKHRKFTDWIDKYMSEKWKLKKYIPNKYPTYSKFNGSKTYSNFYIYELIDN